MLAKIDLNKIIKQLTDLGERQLENETAALNIITQELNNQKIKYKLQKFKTYIPKYIKYNLEADDKSIECLPCGFYSGRIINNYNLISNLTSSQNFIYNANICFNPKSKAISRSNHYFAPALAVKFTDVIKICKAEKVFGELVVEKNKHTSVNLLVGNSKNPKHLVFSHYDSIGTGAVDNASGVALSLKLIIEKPETLRDTLYAICGNEELSYDQTIYWGHGYRIFEKKFPNLIKKTKQIIVLDSFGFGKPVKYTDPKFVILGFPILQIKKFAKKIVMVSGEFEKLMKFYHTNDDKPELIKEEYMIATEKLVLELLQK